MLNLQWPPRVFLISLHLVYQYSEHLNNTPIVTTEEYCRPRLYFPCWSSFHLSQKVTEITGITVIDRNSCSFEKNPPQKWMWNLALKEPLM